MRTTKKTLIVEPKAKRLEAYESFNKALDRSKSQLSKVGLTNNNDAAKDETAVTLAAKGGAIFFAVCRESLRRHRFCRQSRTRGYFDWHPTHQSLGRCSQANFDSHYASKTKQSAPEL